MASTWWSVSTNAAAGPNGCATIRSSIIVVILRMLGRPVEGERWTPSCDRGLSLLCCGTPLEVGDGRRSGNCVDRLHRKRWCPLLRTRRWIAHAHVRRRGPQSGGDTASRLAGVRSHGLRRRRLSRRQGEGVAILASESHLAELPTRLERVTGRALCLDRCGGVLVGDVDGIGTTAHAGTTTWVAQTP